MIGAWFAELPALLVALVVVFVPGLAMGFAVRLRGLSLWAFAPVLSTAATALLALVYGFVGVPWAVGTVAIGCLILVALAVVAGLLIGERAPSPAQPRPSNAVWLLAAGLTIGIVLTVLRFAVYVGEPGAISQTNDAVFHLNAIRFIEETSNASSLHVSGVVGGRGFYPSAWHGLASLVALSTGVAPPVAANVVSLVIAAVVWPLGIAWFARVVSPASAGVPAAAAALAPSLPVFPMMMFQWGVLYSYALAVALVPAAASIVIAAATRPATATSSSRRVQRAVLVALLAGAGLLALALAQPAAIVAWLVIVVSWFAWWVASRIGAASGRERRIFVATLVAVGVAAAGLWVVLARATSGIHWPPFRGKLEVVFDVLLNGPLLLSFTVWVSVLMIIGLVVAVRTPALRWIATVWVVFSGLYVVSAAIGQPTLRRLLLGAFYGDPYRLAALAPIAIIPLAAIGLVVIAAWATRSISDRRGERAELFGTAWALGVVAVLSAVLFAIAPMTQLPRVTENIRDTESRYQTDEFLSEDERALLERLDEHVEPGERVIGNPSTGTGFGYMFSGVDVYPRTWAHPRTDAWRVIREGLDQAGTDPAVCEALEIYGSPGFVLDFGLGEDSPGRFELPAMTGFDGQPGFEFVDSEGDASLWRITACDP
jgi:hypothetical protein